MTSYPRELAEIALAHSVSDATEEAYKRSDVLDRRRPLMEDWAKFCATRPTKAQANVIPLRGRSEQ